MSQNNLNELISRILSSGYLIESDAVDYLLSLGEKSHGIIEKLLSDKKSLGSNIITKEDVVRLDLERRAKEQSIPEVREEVSTEVVFDPTHEISPSTPTGGYRELFLDRYQKLQSLLRKRPDAKGVMPLSSVSSMKEGSRVKVSGLLMNRNERGQGMQITLDDPTGSLEVMCQGSTAEMVARIPLDSLVMLEVTKSHGHLLALNVVTPDVPDRKPTTHPHEVYAVLISDLHVGSKSFLEREFNRFVYWLKGGTEDSDIVRKIRYLIISGDLIDGVGVYPDQETQLSILDPLLQYQKAFQLLSQVPEGVKIVISPGNHDLARQALPQPSIPNWALRGLPVGENVVLVGGPSYVKLGGVLFLIFHGRSLDDMISSIPGLSYRRPSEAMKVMLKSRHLAPTYGKRTSISPEVKDMLVINEVPDVMHCGHVHVVDYQHYKGTLLVNSGTFQGQTSFQANMGLEPTPGIVPIINLSTLSVMVRNFTQ